MVIFPQGKNILEEQFIEPIDLVYLWVDGSEPEWLAKKREYLKNSNIDFSAEAISSCRSADNDELKMSLRSVEKHMPWINKIFIVTDDQIPKWLNTSNPKIKVIFHKDFMPSEILPTFNSNVIELYLHKIPELSEHFLIANDDTFINCDIKPNFFYTKEGKPIVRLQKSICRKIAARSPYAYSILRMQNMIKEKFGSTCTLEPHHNIDAYTKSLCKECEGLFKDEYDKSSCNRFRSNNDIQRSLVLYYALASKQAKLKIVPRTDFYLPFRTKIFNRLLCRYRVDSKYIGIDKKLLKNRFEFVNPKLFCINDNDKATNDDRINAKKFLLTLYPNKSSFELTNNPEISIIVPVYNVEPYLAKCLESLINQSLKNIEIICVNDGSTDNSLKILEEFARNDNRIKIINQENKGVSEARNVGIYNAQGDYLTFVDADDWIEPTTCEKIYNQITCDNSEVLVYSHYNVFPHKKKSYNLASDCNNTLIKTNNIDDLIQKILYVPVVTWGKLYNRKFILENKLIFPINLKQSEDHMFWYNVLSKKPQISICNINLYNYVNIRQGNSMGIFERTYERFFIFEDNVYNTDLYKNASYESKMLIKDRNLNYFLWMWIKHKDKREFLASIIQDRLNKTDNYGRKLRNYKTAKRRLLRYKLKKLFSNKNHKTILPKTVENKISVIIPTIQSSMPLLTNLVKTLDADDSVGEIIIINNVKPKLNLPFSKVRCLDQKTNQFVNKSWDIGIENCKYEYFALINDDLILPKNFCTKILPLLSKDNGIYGIDENCIVNISNNEENNNDNYELFLTKTNKRTPGFGIAMFGHTQNYIEIPKCLKIFCGDDFLFTQNMKNGKQNYLISGCTINHCHQLSSGKLKFDWIKYNDCQNYSKIDKSYVIPKSCRKFNFAEKIIGITNVYENNVKIKYLILLGQQIKIGSSR